MVAIKDIQNLEKMGITFKLNSDNKYANIYKKDKFVGSIYNTKNTIYFCGKEFVETTGKEIIEFLINNSKETLENKQLTNDEIFCIWKQCVLQNKCGHNFDKQFGKEKGYIYNAFRRLGLPKSLEDRLSFDKNILSSLLKQTCYADAKTILKSIGGAI